MIEKSKEIIFEKQSFLGLHISIFDRAELISYLKNTVENNRKSILYGHALWTFPMLKKHPEIYIYGDKADVLVTDGRPFYVLAKIHGLPLKYDISIPNLVILTLQLADKFNWSVYLLGATSEVNIIAQEKIKSKYKNINLVSGHNGYFDPQLDSAKIIKQINVFKPSILLIGITSPTKEKIAYEWKNELNTNIIIPCGGMIDVLAEKTKLTPTIIKKLGLASFYRVLQEPKRLFRRYLYIYGYLFFYFFPLYFYKVILSRDKQYSIVDKNLIVRK